MAQLNAFWTQQKKLHDAYWTDRIMAEMGYPALAQMTPAQLEQAGATLDARIAAIDAEIAKGAAEYQQLRAQLDKGKP